jgi:hypothetical protein
MIHTLASSAQVAPHNLQAAFPVLISHCKNVFLSFVFAAQAARTGLLLPYCFLPLLDGARSTSR